MSVSVVIYSRLLLGFILRSISPFFSNSERTKNELVEDIEMLRFLESGYRIKIIDVNSRTIGVDVPEDIIKVENEMDKLGIDYNDC